MRRRVEEHEQTATAGLSEETPSQPSSALGEAIRRSLRAPGVLRDYQLLRSLGQGGFGEVWEAEDKGSGNRVAIKFFARGAGGNWQALLEEVRRLALLHGDPGIVPLYDVVRDSDPPYYVMKLAEHGSLAGRIEERGRLPLPEALRIFREVAEALAYVHAKGIRHCDLKPANILLDARDRPLIADFGQAQLVKDATPTLGTFFYMAPEQAEARDQIADTRWDVYALGAVMFAMLTGRPPRFDPALLESGAGLTGQLVAYRDGVARAPKPVEHRRVEGMDRPLAEIVDRCLEVEPTLRYRDAGDILDALDRRERRRRRRPALIFGLAAPLALLVAAAGAVHLGAEREVGEARKDLVRQRLEGGRALAQLAARNLDNRLYFRRQQLEKDAAAPGLAAAIRGRDPAAIARVLDGFIADNRRVSHACWTVADRDGAVLARYVRQGDAWRLDPAAAGVDASRAEWFHARPDGHPGPRGLTGAAHICRPGADDGGDPLDTCVSAPVVDGGEVVGVLMARTPPESMYDFLAKLELGGGFAVVLDDRCAVRYHPALARRALGAAGHRPGAGPCPYADLVHGRRAGSSAAHADPIAGGTFLASFHRGDESKWTVLVQHEVGSALLPIDDLRRDLRWYEGLMALTFGALVAVLWALLGRALRREERTAHA